ncbi:MAG: iron-containing alcohol dehydrogenase [Spirochaetaceae bacterium]
MQTSKVTARNQLPHHFAEARVPALYYGAGSISALPKIIADLGVEGSLLLITGKSAFEPHGFGPRLLSLLEEHGHRVVSKRVHGEPSPQIVDRVVSETREALGGEPGAVAAVGGGSVIDSGKAASAAFRHAGSIKEYLEGVGTRKPSGRRLPLIAASTTAGTGSEGTKNAVLSEVGEKGYKKSLRHDAFVPDAAIIDPELHRSAPASVTAASGLDAITQLLEAYVSVKATPFTDLFCEMGLTQAAWAYPRVLNDPEELEARGSMAMAAYLSGLSLATAGLGLVHGAASPLGAARDIPHGVVCGTLIGEVSRKSVTYLFGEGGDTKGGAGLSLAEGADLGRGRHKYAGAGRILTGRHDASEAEAARALVDWLTEITELSGVPRLGEYGFTRQELEKLAPKCGEKNQPVAFDSEATATVLLERL